MSLSPEIIDAVPQSSRNEYENRVRLIWITAGCMGLNGAAFFAGMATPQAGDLLTLWMTSLSLGNGSVWLNLIRKVEFLNKIDSAQTTYTVLPSKGRGRFLQRFLPPGK